MLTFEHFFTHSSAIQTFLLTLQCQYAQYKNIFFIKSAQYTIILQAYFVRVDQLLLVKFWDLKQ